MIFLETCGKNFYHYFVNILGMLHRMLLLLLLFCLFICFCSFELSCSILKKDNFVNLYIV